MYTVPISTESLTYKQALQHLNIQFKLGISPMLETVVDMLAELGDPQKHFDVIQIAGTNGKTSTSRYTAAFLREAGFKVGLYTSPELTKMTERMEIEGAPVSEKLFATGIAAAVAAGQRVNHRRLEKGQKPYDITEFDLLTVAALVMYAAEEIEVAVLEVCMGGRCDATSATNPLITAITGVDLDHTRILGSTKEAIATEKAAIIKAGQKTFLGAGVCNDVSVRKVVEKRCVEVGVKPSYASAEQLGVVDSALEDAPSYQFQNLALAKAIAEAYTNKKFKVQTVTKILRTTPIPGRFEILSGVQTAVETPATDVQSSESRLTTEALREHFHIIDAAHNPQSIEKTLNEVARFSQRHGVTLDLLCAIFADKDVEKMAGIIKCKKDPNASIFLTQTSNARCMDVEELQAIFVAKGIQVAETFKDVACAARALKETNYVAFGSITLAGALKSLAAEGG